MPSHPVLVELTPDNLDQHPCCGIKSSSHEGRRLKNCWLLDNFKKGLRAKVLLADGVTPCGYIEYIPGEYAWRGVNARGYTFIHCIWMHSKRHQGKGMASHMVQDCVADARKVGSLGVAVMTREGPWLASSSLFETNGFEVMDSAPPDYQLLALKFKQSAPNPVFKTDWDARLKRYGHGLTIVRASQCPYGVKFSDEIAQAAKEDYGIMPTIVEIKSHREAQGASTPYTVFSLIYNGLLLADHQISRTRFHNIMKTLDR